MVWGKRPPGRPWPASRSRWTPCSRRCLGKERPMGEVFTVTPLSIVAAGLVVGFIVGLPGRGGGALMPPALIFLGVGGGEAATVVTADLTAAAVYKTGGALVHPRGRPPHLPTGHGAIHGVVAPGLPAAVAGRPTTPPQGQL